jgi:endonuclease YncB( thermonuclease family)
VLVVVALLAVVLDTSVPLAGQGRASDGDSFRLGSERVRLLGIDAPELDQQCRNRSGQDWPCGRLARDHLATLLGRGLADCRIEGHDQFGRLLARCVIGDVDVAKAMVSQGWALSSDDYWAEEAHARDAKIGVWEGDFERPSDWRQDHPRL